METKIVNGTTVISTGNKGGMRNKTGVHGVSEHSSPSHYRVDMVYKKRKYSLGFFKTLEEAKERRLLAEHHRDAGTFVEWYNTLPKYQYQKLSKAEKMKY